MKKPNRTGAGVRLANMSKMPAKKKSCFQITSVTQAQVAAVGAADDTESLDDPDESRTEDVSSEMYDVSRAEYEPACERSSSDEALNNVGETEAPSSNPPQTTQPSGPGVNTSGELRKVHGAQSQSELGSMTRASTPQPAVGSSSTTSTVSCSSRFRVIKLDHGTGEPFRRGRWTCTEFYEKDSEASHAGRTDSIRHASVTLDPAADRDSGLGPSVGSSVSPATHSGPALGSMAEGSHPSLTHQQVLQQSYSSPATHSGKAAAHSSMGGPQPHAAQNVLPIGQNGLPLSEVHIQKSPMMPPPYAPQHPLPGVHPITSQPAALPQHQTEYYQQSQPASVPPGLPGGQLSLPVSSLSAAAGGHVPISAMPLASGAPAASQIGDVGAAVVGSVSAGQPALAALQQPQTAGFGGPGGGVLLGGSAPPHQPQPIGHPASSGVQNVPAVGVGPSAPTGAPAAAALSASSVTVPNATASSLPLGALGVQGLPASGFGQVEVSGGRTSDGLAVAQSPVASGWEAAKPFMSETLQLSSPVTSLFGIHIPVDGEEDR